MDISEIKMFIKEYAYLFWWVRESEKENINLNAVVEAVLNYGDKQCIKKIFELILDNQVFGVRSAKGTQNFVSTQFFDVPKAGLSDIENTK